MFEVYGIPVAWVPYFYTPDNTVQQRSGFMQPQYAYHSSTTGYSLAIPYYYAASPELRPDGDAEFTTQAGYMLAADWRQKLWNGAYEVKLYGAYNQQPRPNSGATGTGAAAPKPRVTSSSTNIGTVGWNAIIESDDTFRRFYNIDSIYAYRARFHHLSEGACGPELFQYVGQPLRQLDRRLRGSASTNTYCRRSRQPPIRLSITITSITNQYLAASSAST